MSAPIRFRELIRGGTCGITDPGYIALGSAQAWAQLWSQLLSNSNSTEPAPAVDWNREMVVAVTLGECSSGGYAITIEQVTATPGFAEIAVRESRPGPDAIVTDGFTQPFHVIALRARPDSISFRRLPSHPS